MRERFYWGVDYYPEHWPEARWPHDAAMMRAAGFNIVRLAEFAWSLLEPRDGVFDFAWLDRAIEVLAAEGMQVILGTPSASVPPWLFHAHPDIAIVDIDGTSRTYGSRRDTTPAAPTYQRYAVRIAAQMAQHYANHPHVIGWQIDNELGDRDYSDHARRAFHVWLQERYPTLDALNTAWGTRFWSHVYTAWDEIPVPRSTSHTLHNPALHLDYDRFLSDCYVDFQQAQIDAIRAHVPAQHVITHNLMGFTYPNINYADLAAPLDFVSWDNYPSAFWRDNPYAVAADTALHHASMWGLKRRSFWVMEQQSGPSGWHIIGPTPRPGQVALWAWQAIAHGADGIVFFRWRTNPRGAEQNWHGILHTDGEPNRRYDEICTMGEQVSRLADQLVTTTPVHDVALLYDYDAMFSFQIHPDNTQFSYSNHIASYYHALHSSGLSAAVLPTSAAWEEYPLLIVPALRLVAAALAERLKAYVEAGGVLVLTVRSGTRDRHNALVQTAFPGLLADLCGITVTDYDSLGANEHRAVTFAEQTATQPQATVWCDVLTPNHAEVLATYTEDFYSGQAAVTWHQYGRGGVIYAGSVGDGAFVQAVLACALQRADVHPVLPMAHLPHVEVTRRRGPHGDILFVLNHDAQAVEVKLPAPAHDQLTDTVHNGHITLGAYGVALLQLQPVAVEQ